MMIDGMMLKRTCLFIRGLGRYKFDESSYLTVGTHHDDNIKLTKFLKLYIYNKGDDII